MYGLAPGGERGFLDGFAQRRVPVASPGDILGGPSVFHGEDALAEQLARVGSHDVRAEDLIRVLARDELDQALRVVVRARAGVGGEREGSHVVFRARRLHL